jgi:sulfatase modifying factor 1
MRPSGPSTRLILALSAFASLAVGGCLADVPPPCPAGAEGCGCEPGRLCAEGLVCANERCAAVACEEATACAGFASPCEDALCVGGRCKIVPTVAGSDPEGVEQPNGDCGVLRCDGQGQVEPREDPEDVPASEGPCRVGVCEGPNPAQVAVARGTACSTDDVPSGFCDGVDGDPKCLVCLPGATRCAGDAVETCGEGGTWSEAIACVRPTPFCAEGRCGELSPGFVLIEPGSFVMGSPPSELGRGDDEAMRQAVLTRAFELGETEVTQGQWLALSGGANPAANRSCGDACPVESVSWWSALAYANALSEAHGFTPCYVLPMGAEACTGSWQAGDLACGASRVAITTGRGVQTCEGYRLPTEAEWEFAARAGTETATWLGDLQGNSPESVEACGGAQPNLDPIAWWRCNLPSTEGDAPQPVKGKAPNPHGLYDMLGNVWEWVWDAYLPTPTLLATNPVVDSAEDDDGSCDADEQVRCGRVYRGGSSANFAEWTRAAARYAVNPSFSIRIIGFRLARTLP